MFDTQVQRLRAAVDDVRARRAHGDPVPAVLIDELALTAAAILEDLTLIENGAPEQCPDLLDENEVPSPWRFSTPVHRGHPRQLNTQQR